MDTPTTEAAVKDMSPVAQSSRSKILLPSPPAGLAMIIQATGNPRISPRELARMISSEPSFTTEILRLANSPLYGLGRRVRTVPQATVAMGMRTIRNSALAHAVRATTSRVNTGDFDRVRFWEDSLRRGCAALVLARRAGFDNPHEAFTISLIQDIGYILMAIAWPTRGGEIQRLMDMPAAQRLSEERRLFGITHPEVLSKHGPDWGFPQDMLDAMAHHHEPEIHIPNRRSMRLWELARAADALADVGQVKACGNTLQSARRLVEALRTRDGVVLDIFALSEELNAEMSAIAVDMRIEIGRQVGYEQLSAAANDSLLRVTDEYEELTRKLELLLKEKEELTKQLQRTNAQLLKLATTDPMTELANRRAYLQRLEEELERVAEGAMPMSLLMIDIDHFKNINDTYGHATGDAVIKAVAGVLVTCTRDVDMVGRLGGEEFSVLLRDTDKEGAEFVATRIRQTIESLEVDFGEVTGVRVTASVGGTTVEREKTTQDKVLSTADAALYESKENGRNKVTWSCSPEAPAR